MNVQRVRIIAVLAVLLINLTGFAANASPRPTPTPMPGASKPAANSPRVSTPTPKGTKSTRSDQHGIGAAALRRLVAAVANAPALTAGGFHLTTPDSIDRFVDWRGSDVTYVALDAGYEFGWAYFNGTYYERYTARFQPGYVGPSTLRWIEAPPTGVEPQSVPDIPQILAASIAREAVAVSVSKNSWTIIGRVQTSLYASSALQYETMQFDSAGHLASITLPGLRLTVTPKAPEPLIKENEIAKVFSDPENTKQP